MPVNLCYTQKVRGFQQEYEKYFSKSIEIRLKRTKHHCSHCGSIAVTIEPQRRHKPSKMQKNGASSWICRIIQYGTMSVDMANRAFKTKMVHP